MTTVGGHELSQFVGHTSTGAVRALAVYLEGPPTTPFSSALGRYERSPEMCQNRHVYTSGDGERALWWSNGSWYFGRDVGKRAGFLTAKENTDVPEDVAVPWMMASAGNGWAELEGVSVVTEEKHIEAAAAALAEAAEAVYVSGATPGGVNAVALGKYTRESSVLNSRHTYINEDAECGPLRMWWMHGDPSGSWYIGPQASAGSRRALLSVADNALLPEAMTSGSTNWQVATNEGFVKAPDVRCSLTPGPPPAVVRALAAVQFVTQAMTTVAVTETMDDRKSLAGGVRVATNSLRKAFDMFDVDGNGSLDADELLAILTRQTAHGATMDIEDAKALVSYFDKDGNGMLDFNEFVEAITSIGTNPQPAH